MNGAKLLRMSAKLALTASFAWLFLGGASAFAQDKKMIIIDKTKSMQTPLTGGEATAAGCDGASDRCECAVILAHDFIEDQFTADAVEMDDFIAVITFGKATLVPSNPQKSGEPFKATGAPPPPVPAESPFLHLRTRRAEIDAAVDGLCESRTTQIADAVCLGADCMDDLNPDYLPLPWTPPRFIYLLTDGGERHSNGPCAGSNARAGDPAPYPAGTWQNLVYLRLGSPTVPWDPDTDPIIDIGYFLTGTVAPFAPGGTLPDGSVLEAPEVTSTVPGDLTDLEFFQTLAQDSGGTFTAIQSSGQAVQDDVPTLSQWGVIILTLLLAGMTLLIIRRRSVTM